MAIILGALNPIGTVVHSMLTESQFQTEAGSGWILADGRSVTGSRYATTTGATNIPDMRGTFLRGKDNGQTRNPDGDLILGTYSADKFASHTHSIPHGAGGGSVGYSANAGGSSPTPGLSTFSTGSNETAPKSTIVNIFIRIN